MDPLHVATLTVQRELPKHEHLGSLPFLCTKNEIMAPLHVATLTVQRELSIKDPTKNETMAPLHVATLTVKRELPNI